MRCFPVAASGRRPTITPASALQRRWAASSRCTRRPVILIEQRMRDVAAEQGQVFDPDRPDNVHRFNMGVFPEGARIIANPYNKIPGFSCDGPGGGSVHFVPGLSCHGLAHDRIGSGHRIPRLAPNRCLAGAVGGGDGRHGGRAHASDGADRAGASGQGVQPAQRRSPAIRDNTSNWGSRAIRLRWRSRLRVLLAGLGALRAELGPEMVR